TSRSGGCDDEEERREIRQATAQGDVGCRGHLRRPPRTDTGTALRRPPHPGLRRGEPGRARPAAQAGGRGVVEVTGTVPLDPPSALLPNKRHRGGGLSPGIEAAPESREVAKYAAMNDRGQRPTITGPVELEVHAAYGYKRVTPDLDG